MQFKYIIAFCSLLLSTTVLAAPVPEPQVDADVSLARRSVTPHFTFTNDLANIVIPPPAPAGSPKKVVAAQEKKIKKAKANQAARVKLQDAASARVSVVLKAASAPLDLSGSLAVTVTNDFHTSKDPESHATFQFTAAACGGTCVGHAYKTASKHSPGKGQPGKIFSASHAVIFGGTDI
ncbi:hypothetical protein EW146_g2301 [Bondarzewia mesenterica]|uniref:Uncharacterized protein n=1 Tax=Bondarzewia mesenterica TaxID=1095465 RepID=A0A4S4M2Y0_9AGAM|nr:hypothetical protein EW146_g2301 [Bondarzewia mesenterica]